MTNKPAWAADARQGQLRRYKKLVFFACEGLIALYDERSDDEDYDILTPGDFEYRAEQLAALAKKMEVDDRKWMRQEGRIYRRGCQEMKEAVKEAKHMGDPSDPAVQAFWTRHRRSSTITLKGGADRAGYPALPYVDRGRFTGRTAEPDGELLIPDNDPQMKIRRKPVKKQRTGIILGDML